MSIKILDGGGTGREAKVDTENRLCVAGVSQTPLVNAVQNNLGYTVSVPEITLTSAGESALYYVKNIDPDQNLRLVVMRVSLGASTGGSGQAKLRLMKTPTAGTLITAGTALPPVNKNLGSTIPAQATSLYGAEGSTATGGTELMASIVTPPVAVEHDLSFLAPNGQGIAVYITPPTSNTSMAVRIYLQMYNE